jgi:hypothetical protein
MLRDQWKVPTNGIQEKMLNFIKCIFRIYGNSIVSLFLFSPLIGILINSFIFILLVLLEY